MSLTLILTRHAKSSWDDPRLDDFDRPLNGRGRNSAAAIGAWLASRNFVPEEVIVSGARRTVETWERMRPEMPEVAPMRSDPMLYHANAPAMMGVLRSATAPIVLMIAHNPGIAEFAERMVETPPDHPRFFDYPTCATTVMQLPEKNWADATWQSAQVIDFVVPRELE